MIILDEAKILRLQYEEGRVYRLSRPPSFYIGSTTRRSAVERLARVARWEASRG